MLFDPNIILSLQVGPNANEFWLIDGNIKIWVDHESDETRPFEGSVLYNTIKASKPHSVVKGSIATNRKSSTSARNTFGAMGIVYRSDRWERTELKTSMRFYNFVKTSNQTSKASLIQQTAISSITKSTVGKDGIPNQVNVYKVEKHYPLKINTLYTTDGSKFDIQANIFHGYETKSRNNNELYSETNMQNAAGNFGTIKRGSAFLEQELRIRNDLSCYSRKVQANGSIIDHDIVSKC